MTDSHSTRATTLLRQRFQPAGHENALGDAAGSMPAAPTLSSQAAVIQAVDALFQNSTPPAVEPSSPALARIAVERLAACFASAPRTLTDALDGARDGAEVLSTDRLQGLSEIVQNADDAGATQVEFAFGVEELVVTHDGRPVDLRDVLALATPWLTTKRADPGTIGRFGIGLMTLQALSPALEVFSGPYSIRLERPSLSWVETAPPAAVARAPHQTVLRVPLAPGVVGKDDAVHWTERWDDAALLFCANVREVRVRIEDEELCTLRLDWEEAGDAEILIGGTPCTARRRRALARDGRSWAVHTSEVPSPRGVTRSRKARAKTTPLAVALPISHADRGSVYAGLPLARIGLPVRLHGQFDPTSSRQGLAATKWNEALYALAADLWTAAAVHLFAEHPAAAWGIVPLGIPGQDLDGTAALAELLLGRARGELPARIAVLVGTVMLPLAELAFEAPRLTGVITDVEVARLAEVGGALPAAARDPSGRWRQVLDDWRKAGAALPPPVGVAAALSLLSERRREPEGVIALAAAGVDENLHEQLCEVPSVVLADGSRTSPPRNADPWLLVTEAGGLGATLGVTRVLHPGYMSGSRAAATVLKWLRHTGMLVEAGHESPVLARLSRAGMAGRRMPDPLSNAQLVALRDALDRLDSEGRAALAPGLGRVVRLQAYRYSAGGTREEIIESPAAAYLPSQIERGREPGFSDAAADTPGLVWLHGRYAKVLRSPGRTRLGPLRFLQLLGAETVPRLRPHPRLHHRYNGQRKGLPRWIEGGPRSRERELAKLSATYTLDDLDSPDLTAVLRSIAGERKAGRRRARAGAMLAALARGWDRLANRSVVVAASDYYSWQPRGKTRAFWLSEAAEIPWLDDSKGNAAVPVALRRRTPANVAVNGPSAAGYLHKDLQQHPEVLTALGVAGDPEIGKLVARLQALRGESPPPPDLGTHVALLYRTLAERLDDGTRLPGDLSTAEVLAAFSAPPGLLLTNLGWHEPARVLTGPPIFGRWRAFALGVQGAKRLWAMLKLRDPSPADCIDVLSRMGRTGAVPEAEDQVVMLDCLRHLAQGDALSDRRLAKQLEKLPLWTSNGWTDDRPVYAVADLPLADGLKRFLPIWEPGGDISQFQTILPSLRLTVIPAESAAVIAPEEAEVDNEATEVFGSAVKLLKEDLIRNERAAAAGIATHWEHLAALQVRITPALRVRVTDLPEGEVIAPVAAKLDLDARVLFLRDSAQLDRVDAGGRAIAGLFGTDARRIAQAWLAACQEARTGREAMRLRLAEERAAVEEADLARSLAELQAGIARAEQRRARGGTSGVEVPASTPRRGGGAGQRSDPAPSKRVLVDPSRYDVVDPAGRIEPPRNGRESEGTGARSNAGLPAPRPGGAAPRSGAPAPGYTAAEREKVGMELLRKVLGRDDREVRDFRGQHGLGADLVDLEKRFWELKVYAGPEPDQINLQASQVQRAAGGDDFFIVVVSSVEGEDARPKVRIIPNPLVQLRASESSSIPFTGVRSAGSLVFDLGPVSEPAIEGSR